MERAVVWSTIVNYDLGEPITSLFKHSQNTFVDSTVFHLSISDPEDGSDSVAGPVFNSSNNVLWDRHIS